MGRKQAQKNDCNFKIHDIEIVNDKTVSSNQCYFAYWPKEKKWFIQDG